jgi:toxin YoeB
MEIELTDEAQVDIEFWKRSGDVKIMQKITNLIVSISETPFSGIGKPEALRYNLAGLWSRRINKEHRLVYEVLDKRIVILSLKGHY